MGVRTAHPQPPLLLTTAQGQGTWGPPTPATWGPCFHARAAPTSFRHIRNPAPTSELKCAWGPGNPESFTRKKTRVWGDFCRWRRERERERGREREKEIEVP